LKFNFIKAITSKVVKENMPITECIKIAKELMPMISDERADNYESWHEMGRVWYCLGDGSQEALEEWIKFSAKTSRDNFNEAKCVYEWENNLAGFNYTIGTLKYYAGQDTPDKYETWKKTQQKKRFKDSLNGGQYDIAKMLHDVHGTNFVCASIEKDLWYEFRGHKWFKTEKAHSLRTKISTEIVQKFIDEGKKLYNDMMDGGDEDEAPKKQKVINKIIAQLKSSSFKKGILTEAQELFYNELFYDNLDTNINLLGFENGVFDCKTLEFRNGKPEDYISMTTGYNYKEFSDDDTEVLDVKDILIKIFPDPNLRIYFLEYCASLLKGGNAAKTFLVMSGEGDNGKSIIIELIEYALGRGKYAIKFPTTLITDKRAGSSAASPELARVHGVRFAVLQEPSPDAFLNLGTLKELTGNDSFYARTLFKEGREITPMFKMVLICNLLPRLSADDPATWNRIKVLLFEAWFPKNPNMVPKDFGEQMKKKIFYRDSTLSEKLPSLKQAFMWILVQTLKNIRKNGYTAEPEKVLEATSIYRRNNDTLLQFLTESIVADLEDKKAILNINEIFVAFNEWFKTAYPKIPPPNKIIFMGDLVRRWGAPNIGINKWCGYRFRNVKDDEKDGKILIHIPEKVENENDLEVKDDNENECQNDEKEEKQNDNKHWDEEEKEKEMDEQNKQEKQSSASDISSLFSDDLDEVSSKKSYENDCKDEKKKGSRELKASGIKEKEKIKYIVKENNDLDNDNDVDMTDEDSTIGLTASKRSFLRGKRNSPSKMIR
jgi:P4 family phage/plasmid primase-like protien